MKRLRSSKIAWGKKIKERKGRIGKKGRFKGEKLSTLAGPMNASAYRHMRGYSQQRLRK